MKKYDDKSVYFRKWSTKKLKAEAKGYYQSIYVSECYGVRDMLAYSGILTELERRGIEPRLDLSF